MIMSRDSSVSFINLDVCLACGGEHISSILSLGDQPLANDLKFEGEDYDVFPLELNLCQNCFHAQLSISVDPALLFKHYLYESGTTKTLTDYFDYFVKKYVCALGKNLKVIDIASNDGSLVKSIMDHGHVGLGVDPASNLLTGAMKRNVTTINGFWPEPIQRFLSPDIDVYIAMNVLAHVRNPLDFLIACKNTLADDGVIYVQTSQAKFIELHQFDTIYHEHLSFFNTSSMLSLANRAGLDLVDVVYEDIHGLSYVWTLRKNKNNIDLESNLITQHETEIKLFSQDRYTDFADHAKSIVNEIKKSLEEKRSEGYVLVGYGVAAKGNTVIQFADLDLDFMIDDNPLKQGRIIPGKGIKIFPSSKISEVEKPICYLIPAWNFRDEILDRIRTKRSPEVLEHDKAIVYFPHFAEFGVSDVK
jgi:2-polyprenyl-3-methyl-5-hydroxy-6-metoxy-1,4-benzoquinol methylase